jgi:hypothetical protein
MRATRVGFKASPVPPYPCLQADPALHALALGGAGVKPSRWHQCLLVPGVYRDLTR